LVSKDLTIRFWFKVKYYLVLNRTANIYILLSIIHICRVQFLFKYSLFNCTFKNPSVIRSMMIDARLSSRNSPKNKYDPVKDPENGNALQSFTENEKRVEEVTSRGRTSEKKSRRKKRNSKVSSNSHLTMSKNHQSPDRMSNPFNSYRKMSPKSNSKILSTGGSPVSYNKLVK